MGPIASNVIRGLLVITLWVVPAIQAQEIVHEEIPLERCDVLPVVKVKIADTNKQFLVDTGATAILNLKSFSAGQSKQVRIESWKGGAATSAREVVLSEMQLGSHKLHDIKLPAIDLSPIGKACGGQIDGILGVDLLDKFGVTLDFKRRVALLEGPATNTQAQFDAMEAAMHPCFNAFNNGDAKVLEECFDPEIVLYSSGGEFRGRAEVMKYLNERFLKFAPNVRYESVPHDVRSFGDALWYSYDYKITIPGQSIAGHGMSMCRKRDGKWRILNMHNALLQNAAGSLPQ
jgi:ketosteroid isomerase-like protein